MKSWYLELLIFQSQLPHQLKNCSAPFTWCTQLTPSPIIEMNVSSSSWKKQKEKKKTMSQLYPYSPHRRDWNSLRVGFSLRPTNVRKGTKPEACYTFLLKFHWISRGVGWERVLIENPFHNGCIDIFWNYTIRIPMCCWLTIGACSSGDCY